jgi:hypothetical protein
MIDVLCLREAYERRQITEVKWIATGTNPADTMSKAKSHGALKDLIDTGKYNLQEEAKVTRKEQEQEQEQEEEDHIL